MQHLRVENVVTGLQYLLELFCEVLEEEQAFRVPIILKQLLSNLRVSDDECQATEHFNYDLLVLRLELLSVREDLEKLKEVVLCVQLLHTEQVESVVSKQLEEGEVLEDFLAQVASPELRVTGLRFLPFIVLVIDNT